MNILLYARGNVGLIAGLTIKAAGENLVFMIPECKDTEEFCVDYGIASWSPSIINTKTFLDIMDFYRIDLLLCVHGHKIINKATLAKVLCVNVHPCLSVYPGTDPIRKVIRDQCTRVSVGVHIMTECVDVGPVIIEKWTEIEVHPTREQIYNQLYPLYAKTIKEALWRIKQGWLYR